MSTNRAAVIEPVSKRRGKKSDLPSNPLVRLRIAERPARNRIQHLLELAFSLSKELESLFRDKNFTEQSDRLQTLDLSEGVDFYDEVQHFETGLIKVALDHTGGNQAKAAKLLRIKPTTLNSKIKLYNIEY